MKITFKRLLFTFALMFGAQLLFAEDGAIVDNAIEASYGTFALFVVAITTAVEFTKRISGVTEKTANFVVQLISWVTGLVLAIFGWYFELGIFADITWKLALLYGLGGGLVSNGIADTKVIQWLFDIISKKSVQG